MPLMPRRFELLSRNLFFAALLVVGSGGAAMADIIYRPTNPSFGGDSFNSSHLQGLAGSQNLHKPSSSSSSQSESDRFVSMLQSRLYSSLASQVADAIFGDNAQPHGVITFDDQRISFNNTGTSIELTIEDLATGQITTIIVPALTN
jgi:curli production assembly/transport component CsgF